MKVINSLVPVLFLLFDIPICAQEKCVKVESDSSKNKDAVEVSKVILGTTERIGPIWLLKNSQVVAYGYVMNERYVCMIEDKDTVMLQNNFPDMYFLYDRFPNSRDTLWKTSAVGYGGAWHWSNFSDSQFLQYFCCYSDANGTFVKCFYPNGRILKEGYVRKQHYSGTWKFYAENGEIKEFKDMKGPFQP